MAKKLVLCLDGTSNRYCQDNTNVVKLAALLDKSANDQLLYYQPGIGTMPPPGVFNKFRQWFLTRLDLAFAILLKQHVQDAYRFLMRYHEDGDQIYLFGFSRGAYTARVLAGMLCKVGLLARGNEELVPFAWDMFSTQGNAPQADGFCTTFSRRVTVDFIGVWDTVSSVRYAGRDQHFPYTYDNPIVRTIRHAIALDERRAYFRQNLWIDPARQGQDSRQVWFPGVHCDVGGGYREADSGLSKIALQWMLDEIGPRLKFQQIARNVMLPSTNSKDYAAPSATARIHELLRALWHIVEYIPKRINIKQPDNSYTTHWILPRGHHRSVPKNAVMDPSIHDRIRLDATYRPPNLPADPSST